MNHLIAIGFFFCLAMASCKKDLTQEEIDPDSGFRIVYTLSEKDQVYHGPYSKFDSTGILLEKGHYASGELEGIREIFFPDGKVKIRERYKAGIIDDLYEYYHSNGQVELRGYYIDGEMYGTWSKFDDKGNVIEHVTMISNEEMGPFTEYYPDGKLQAEGMYLHGPNEHGELKLFNESGELYKTMLCDSGICVTIWEKK